MSSTIQNTDSVSSFALVIGLIIVLSLLVGIGAIIYRKKYHLNFKKFFAKFKNNYNNKINGKNNKINGGKNIKNNNNNIKNNNNNIKNGNGDGNGKTNKKNIKNKDDGTNKNKNYQGYNSSNPRSKTAKNDNNVLPNNNLFLTKNNVLANNNNNNNRNISQQSKLLNHQNIEKEKEEKIRNKNHLQQPINTSVMNEITRLPTAYAPRVRVLRDDNKRSKSETFSSSPLSYPSLSTSTKYLKPTQTKPFVPIKPKPFVPIKPLNSSLAISSSNKAKNDHLSIDESHYESSQNSSQTIVLNLCDYYTYDDNTIDNRHSKGNYIDSYYHNSNYSGNAEQAEDHRNYDNDTNNNENGNKIKIDVNESPPVNVKPTSSKLKKNSYDNYSMSSSPPLEPLSPPPQSTTPPLPPPPSTLQNDESSSSSSTSTSTIIRPKNFSISDSFKPLASSSPSSPTSISTPTIIRPKNFSISDSFKPLTPSPPSSASRLNSWLTSSPNKNDNVKNDKFLTLDQNTDGNIASSDSTPTNNRYTNNDIYDNYIYSEDENNYNYNNNHESFFINQRKNTTAIPPAADSTHQRNLQIVTQTLDSSTPPQTPLTPRQAQLQPFRINSIVDIDNNNNSNNRNSGYVEYGESDVSNHSSYLCSNEEDEESIYYSKTDSVSIDPHLYDKSSTNSIYYSNDEDVDKNNSEEDNNGNDNDDNDDDDGDDDYDDDDDDDDDVQNIINTTVLIDDASKKISRVELIKESEHEYEHRYGEDYKGGDHNEKAIVFDSRNYDNDNEINILVDDKDFDKSKISDSPIELPKLPKILVNKNLSINFERFSLFRNAPGWIDKDGFYYYDHNRNLNGNGNSNNRVANAYIKPGHR